MHIRASLHCASHNVYGKQHYKVQGKQQFKCSLHSASRIEKYHDTDEKKNTKVKL